MVIVILKLITKKLLWDLSLREMYLFSVETTQEMFTEITMSKKLMFYNDAISLFFNRLSYYIKSL